MTVGETTISGTTEVIHNLQRQKVVVVRFVKSLCYVNNCLFVYKMETVLKVAEVTADVGSVVKKVTLPENVPREVVEAAAGRFQ